MRIRRLRNKLLLSAVIISTLTALAYMLAVAWVIRQQHLHQSEAVLQKSATVIADNLAERKSSLLAVSQRLVAQRNLGTTIWYLEQYARADLDQETLHHTYLQLAVESQKSGRTANVSKIAIYNSAGHLVSFALFDEKIEQVGFVEGFPVAKLKIAALTAGEEISDSKLQTVNALPRLITELALPLPRQERAHYAVVEGKLSIETQSPIMDDAFDPATGKLETKQVGVVIMVQPLGPAFAKQLAKLTDTDINVFTAQGLSSGSLASYQQPDWGGPSRHQRRPSSSMKSPSRAKAITRG